MRIRRFRVGDASATSRCVIRTLREANAKHYPKRVIDFIIAENRPREVVKRALERDMLIVEDGKTIVGTVNLTKDGWISAFFVEPARQGRGIGTRLLAAIERIAKKKGFKAIRAHCAVNSVGFYKKNGYRVVRQVVFRNYGRTYRLFKRLRPG